MRKLLLAILSVAALLTFASVGVAAPRGGQGDEHAPTHCDDSESVDPSGPKGNDRCPENPPCDADHGIPLLRSPQCAEPDPDPDPACPDLALPGNVNLQIEGLASVCVVAFILGGTGEPHCPEGTLRIPETGNLNLLTDDGEGRIVALCVTIVPDPEA